MEAVQQLEAGWLPRQMKHQGPVSLGNGHGVDWALWYRRCRAVLGREVKCGEPLDPPELARLGFQHAAAALGRWQAPSEGGRSPIKR